MLVFVEAQPAQHLGDAHLVIVTAGRLKSRLRVPVFFEQGFIIVASRGRRLSQAVFHGRQRGALGAQRRKHGLHGLVQGVLARRRWVLR